MLVGLVASTACRSSRRWTGRRVLYYGQDLARPMPRAHILWSKVTLVAPSPIGNAYLGSGRLPRPGSPRISQTPGNSHREWEFPGVPGNSRPLRSRSPGIGQLYLLLLRMPSEETKDAENDGECLVITCGLLDKAPLAVHRAITQRECYVRPLRS